MNTTQTQMGDGLTSEDDEYSTIMIRIFDDHRDDNYMEFRINYVYYERIEKIIDELKFMEAEN